MGRRDMKPEDKVDIRLRMDQDLARRIQDMADRFGQPVAVFIRSAVIKEMERINREDAR